MSSTISSLFPGGGGDSKSSVGIEKLDGSVGFPAWQFQIRLFLQQKGLWGIVSGTDPKPTSITHTDDAGNTTSTTSTEVEEWSKKDAQAMMYISMSISRTQIAHIIAKETSKEAWDNLEKIHRKEGQSALYTLLSQLINARYKDGDDLNDHLTSMLNISNDLRLIQEGVPDHHLVVYLLQSLPPSWSTFVSTIEIIAGDKKTSSDTVIAQITKEASRRKNSDDSSTGGRKSNAGALSSQSQQPRAGYRRDKRNDECYNCHKKGHHSKECRAPRAEAKKATRNVYSLLIQRLNVQVSAASILEEIEKWIVDSGAGYHYTGRKDGLGNFVNSPLTVEIADGSRKVCPGYGSLDLELKNGHRLHLERVYYLPGATTALLSVSSICENGGSVNFAGDIASVFIGKDHAFDTIPGSSYQLDLLSPSPSPSIVASTREASSAPLMTWHQRLGHISLDAVLELERSGAVQGMVLKDRIKRDCESCLVSKSRRSPFTSISSPAPHTLYRLFIDLGFVTDADFDGNKIYLAIVDQYSTAKWTFILTSKRSEEVLEKWLEFKKNIEKMTGRKIRFVRSDNGGEFINSKFVKALRDAGITYENTAAYTPEQNGQVERLNNSLIELTKSMLKASKLSNKYWSAAIQVATFVLNRIPHPRFKGKTAYEIALGKVPSVQHLRPFGTVCYTHIDSTLRTKLEDSAERGILIGYSGEYNYLVKLDSGRTITSRHVRFADSQFGIDEIRLPLDDTPFPLPDDTPPSDHEQVPSLPSPITTPSSTPATQTLPAPKDGHEYILVPTGRNPGRFEEIDESNIIEGSRRRATFVDRYNASDHSVFVKVCRVVDDEGGGGDDETWEEESILVGVAQSDLPRTHDEAMASKERVQWRDAEEREWTAFEENGVLRLTSLPQGARALGTTWVYTIKTDELGKILKYKARLVAQGFAQRPGIDFNETFAAVSRMSTVRFLIAYAASNGFNIQAFDYETAFLNGSMTEDVFIKIPPGYPHRHQPGQVLKLEKAMYGTKQAPREWAKTLNTLMLRHGYSQSSSDTCLYFKVEGGSLVIVLLYVDDGLIVAKDLKVVEEELEAFAKVYKLKKLGQVSTFLSMQFAHSPSGIFVHQSKYIDHILSRYFDNLSRSPATTPMDDKLVVDPSSPLFSDIALFQSAVGALQYAAQLTRPDIAAAVRRVAQAVSTPTEQDWQAVKRIFRYLVGTKDWGIRYKRGGSLELVVYSDASWADDQENRRSVGAFAILIAGGVIGWRSKQQSLIATSTTESELVAVSDSTKEVLSYRQLFDELGIDQPSATTIFEDNQACIALAQNPAFHARTKHFSVVTLFVRERVAIGDIKLEYCRTEEMTADVLTKGLGKSLFLKHREGLGMVSLSSWIGGSVGEKISAASCT